MTMAEAERLTASITAPRRKRCVIYLRISGSKKQLDGASLDVQLEQARTYATRAGWTVVREFRDTKTGLVAERAAYQEMLALIEAGEVDVVLVWRLDRFGRDDGEGITRCNELDRKHVEFHSVMQGHLDPLTRGILFVVAKNESRAISERVHPNTAQRVKQGKWPGPPPYGYRKRKDFPGLMDPCEPEASCLQEIWRRFLGGETLYSILGWLNTQTRYRPQRAAHFEMGWLQSAIRNRAYAGWVPWNETRRSKLDGSYKRPPEDHMCYPGLHKPLVSQADFDAAQQILADTHTDARRWNGGHNSGQFILTGILRCGICGKGMYGQWNNYSRFKAQGLTPPPGHGFMYKCMKKGHMLRSGRALDALVLAELGRLPVGPQAAAIVHGILDREIATRPDRLHDLQGARATHTRARKDLTLGLAYGRITQEDYDAAIADIDCALATLDRELAALEPDALTITYLEHATAWLCKVENLAALLETATVAQVAGYVGGAITRIVVHDKGGAPEIVWHEWAQQVWTEEATVGADMEKKNEGLPSLAFYRSPRRAISANCSAMAR